DGAWPARLAADKILPGGPQESARDLCRDRHGHGGRSGRGTPAAARKPGKRLPARGAFGNSVSRCPAGVVPTAGGVLGVGGLRVRGSALTACRFAPSVAPNALLGSHGGRETTSKHTTRPAERQDG